jgi:hypothetical protein
MAGASAGLFSGCLLFPSNDELANAYAPLVASVVTLLAWVVAFVAGLIGHRLSASNKNARRVIWVALVGCVAFGPVGLAITPPVVNRRIARNDHLAAARFQSLKDAAAQTKADKVSRGPLCDADALRRHYSGPQFSKQDWQRIAENFATHKDYALKQDSYTFLVKCRETVGYTIEAAPDPLDSKASSKRRFCSDQCKEWLRSQHLCSACTE